MANDAFFQKKRKRTSSGGVDAAEKRNRVSAKRRTRDQPDEDDNADLAGEEGPVGADMDLRHNYDSGSEDEDETAAQARVRLAKAYLEGIKADEDRAQADFEYGADAAEIDRQNISARLQRDVEEQTSRMHLLISQYLRVPAPSSTEQLRSDLDAGKDILSPLMDLGNTTFGVRGHQQSVTCVAVTPDCRYLYTGSKEGHIFKWSLADGHLVRVLGKKRRVSDSYRATIQRKATAHTASETASKRSGAARRRAMWAKKERSALTAAGVPQDDQASHDSLLWPQLAEDQGHTDALLALAISPDGKYLVSGGKDRRIGIWTVPATDLEGSPHGKMERWVKSLGGHKDTITALQFRLSSSSPYELFSASFDRSVKVWAVDQGSYVETLFGHQDPVLDLDLLREETAVSVGGRDRSVRFWKVRNESQLVFRAGGLGKGARTKKKPLDGDEFLEEEPTSTPQDDDDLHSVAKQLVAERQDASGVGPRDFYEGSVDCVAMVDGSHFLSAGDSGTIALWSTGKKKPVFTWPVAHGYDTVQSSDSSGTPSSQTTLHQPRWITALATLPFGDIFVSGSWDGRVRLWALDRRLREFRPLYSIDAPGYVNALRLATPPATKDIPEGTLLSGRLNPAAWKRTGLGDKATRSASGTQHPQEGEKEEEQVQRQVGAMARTERERLAPLLVVGLGKEPRLGRWTKKNATHPPGFPEQNVRNGTMVVVLPLQH